MKNETNKSVIKDPNDRKELTEAQKIFSKNLNELLRSTEKTQLDLANYVKVSTTSVNNWVKGYNTPRMDKIDKICEFFGVNRENLLSEEFKNALIFSGDFDSWKDARFAEKIFNDLDFRELIYTLENSSSAQLRALTNMIRLLKSKTNV